MDNPYQLAFQLRALGRLDALVLPAWNAYNRQSDRDWFGDFRSATAALYSRVYGVQVHYQAVHSWGPRWTPGLVDYHVASVLFNMVSAVECLTFSLNALGCYWEPTLFRDVAASAQLRDVSPWDVGGRPRQRRNRCPGYEQFFPGLYAYWEEPANRSLLERLYDQHAVSKHQGSVYGSGQQHIEAPAGFYEALGLPEDPVLRSRYWPMREIYLHHLPREPRHQRFPGPADGEFLEELVGEFVPFLNASCDRALEDASVSLARTAP